MTLSSVVHVREPFGQIVAQHQVKAGTKIRDTKPDADGLLVCRINGGPGFVSAKNWDHGVPPGTVEWIEYPGGGKGGGGALQIILAAIVSIATENPYPLLLAIAGQAINFFLDNPRQEDEQFGVSPTYATGLQGNQARLYNVIPKICGRHQSFPPFATQPYTEFDDTGEQYLNVVLALGIGNHEVERILIDDTDIRHFADVVTATYLPPGVGPSIARINVINSPEVSGHEMLTGQYIGGFVACRPRSLVSEIGIDIVMQRGCGVQDVEGNLSSLEVRWRVEVCEVNEFGTRITPWTVLASEARTASSREPQKWSTLYELPTPIRAQIRLVRLDVKSANVRVLNDMAWSGMRAYVDADATLNPDVAHIEVVMRSSKQLNGVSQNRISVIATGMCRELLSNLTFGDEIPSRNPADWLADLWTSSTWGEGLDESQVDLRTLYALRVLWEQRQDRFDYIFDTATDADAAAQIIAEAGRARAFRRGGLRTLARDQLATLPRTAFCTRNTRPGTMTITETLPVQDTPDGVIIEYFDNRSWDFGDPIECPCPGVTSMQRPRRIRKPGVTGRIHATREGLYEAAKIALRRRVGSCYTEMEGSLPAFGSAARWQSEVTRWQSGDVVSWDSETSVAVLSEPPNWGETPFVIVFIRDDGKPTDPIEVLPGDDRNAVILSTPPDFDPVTEDGTRDRTRYLLGAIGEDEMIVKVAGISDGGTEKGAQLYKIDVFVDDDRIHLADNAYLPSPGEIQDPIDTTEGEPGGGEAPVVNISDRDTATASPNTMSYHFNMDGTVGDTFNPGSAYATLVDQWLLGSPREASEIAQFEVFFQLIGSYDNGDPGNLSGLEHMGSWLAIDQDFVFTATNSGSNTAYMEFNILIRDIATLTVQDQARIYVAVYDTAGGGG